MSKKLLGSIDLLSHFAKCKNRQSKIYFHTNPSNLRIKCSHNFLFVFILSQMKVLYYYSVRSNKVCKVDG